MNRTIQAESLLVRSALSSVAPRIWLALSLAAATVGIGGCTASSAVNRPSNSPETELTHPTTAPPNGSVSAVISVPAVPPPVVASPPNSVAPVVTPEPAAEPTRGQDVSPIKIGILHSLSGTMATSETSLKDVALMTIELINKNGGVLQRPLQPVVKDPASNWPLFAERARELLQKDEVAAVFGG